MTDRRLDKITGQLTPQQAVLLWMQEAHQHQTISGYMDSLQDAPDTKYPMMWLPRQVRQAVHTAMKGEKPDVILRAERKAVREVAFLFYLQLQVNTRLWGDWRAMNLQLAYVASKLGALFQEEEPSEQDLEKAHEHTAKAVLEFLEWDVAVRKIAERYYAGTSPLFPWYAMQLAGAVENAEQVVELFNDELDWRTWKRAEGAKGKRQKRPALAVEPLDLDELRAAIEPIGVDLARHIVVMAQAEAAEFMRGDAPGTGNRAGAAVAGIRQRAQRVGSGAARSGAAAVTGVAPAGNSSRRPFIRRSRVARWVSSRGPSGPECASTAVNAAAGTWCATQNPTAVAVPTRGCPSSTPISPISPNTPGATTGATTVCPRAPNAATRTEPTVST
jgi:hypothetical protein